MKEAAELQWTPSGGNRLLFNGTGHHLGTRCKCDEKLGVSTLGHSAQAFVFFSRWSEVLVTLNPERPAGPSFHLNCEMCPHVLDGLDPYFQE